MKKILVVEDDVTLNDALTYDLTAEGYTIGSCYDGASALLYLYSSVVDLILLDVNLPDMSGFDFIKQAKNKYPNITVMFLSACDLDEDILKGYDLGADEYVTKPFNTKILHRKIYALLKRKEGNSRCDFDDGHLEVNIRKCLVKVEGKDIIVTPTEFKILKYIFENKHSITTRDNMITALWDINNNFIDEHTLTVNINRLRKKIEDESHKYIKTVYGLGYIWSGNCHEE